MSRYKQNITNEEELDDGTTFVSIGTPCDVPEEDESLKKTAKVSDQIVVDKHGKRRFHGAFTGGFSAGYFNTVGSKEGWTPSTFVSSRSKKHDYDKTYSPADFMDEDDFGDHGIAPRKLKTTQPYESTENDLAKRKRNLRTEVMESDLHSSIPGGIPLDEFIIPTNISIGVKLLRKMGWKPGQGIGEKLDFSTAKSTDDSSMKKVYGCERPSQDVVDSLDMRTFIGLLPPKDVKLIHFTQKDNLHGLGYSGIDPVTAMFYGSTAATNTRKKDFRPTGKEKKGIRGQAFGLGVFEEDDDDIYADEEVLDHELFDEHEEGGEQKRTKSLHGWTAPQPKIKNKGCLDGFIKAVKTIQIEIPRFVLPLPPGYVPKHVFPGQKKSRWSDKTEEVANKTITQNAKKKLDVEERSIMIGEKTLDKSRWLLKWDRKGPEESGSEEKSSVDKIEKILEPVKDGLQKGSLTEWERKKELDDMSKANELYRPLKGIMAARFTHGNQQNSDNTDDSIPDDKKAAKLGMYGKLTRVVIEWHPDKVLCKRFNVPNPYPHSSMKGTRMTNSTSSQPGVMGMLQYGGPLDTGDVEDSVKVENDESSSSAAVESKKRKKRFTEGPLSHLNVDRRTDMQQKTMTDTSNIQQTPVVDSLPTEPTETVDLQQQGSTANDADTEPPVSRNNKKPSIDVFKSIFDDSESSSSSDDDESEKNGDQNDDQRLKSEIESTGDRSKGDLSVEKDVAKSSVDDNTKPKIQFHISKKADHKSTALSNRQDSFHSKTLAFLNENSPVDDKAVGNQSLEKMFEKKKSTSPAAATNLSRDVVLDGSETNGRKQEKDDVNVKELTVTCGQEERVNNDVKLSWSRPSTNKPLNTTVLKSGQKGFDESEHKENKERHDKHSSQSEEDQWEEESSSRRKKSKKSKKHSSSKSKKKHKKRKYNTNTSSEDNDDDDDDDDDRLSKHHKRKQKKKSEKKKKRKRERKHSESYSSDSDCSDREDNRGGSVKTPSNAELLEKLKKFSNKTNKRPSAADFM